ncbi:ComEA family DNA-binding protein [Legionella jamestowniensis]|uniref:Competence protein ComEA n=1 Tax=Legionella jamestowniensis TaxID=455 RepID=A0A0W0UGV1_9GAMM|nr:helix-hairpin-helix domain-containing protein [Legionella jamestowniensis]KTD06777.1 competence protein ComEA [Legionella jamestowniensis]OCH97231.1 competence protein ComEA [Legionella jamestowniensis]SFL83433.1 competence protein ComEA [Legionella jamestowniensis DSM 19215]
MKANLFAAVLSLCIVSLPLHAKVEVVSPNYTKTKAPLSKINLNTADVNTLSKSVKGIGKKRAEAIVRYREEHHGFKTLEELSQVKGLGKQFVKNNLSKLQEVFTLD